MGNNINKIIDSVIEFTRNYEQRYCKTLSNVHWIEQDKCAIDGDYCNECVRYALKIKKKNSKKLGVKSKFTRTASYCGYQQESFISCDFCGKSLDIDIIPSSWTLDSIDDELDTLDTKENFDDYLGYRVFWVLANRFCESSKTHKFNYEIELTNKIAKRVFKMFNLKTTTK